MYNIHFFDFPFPFLAFQGLNSDFFSHKPRLLRFLHSSVPLLDSGTSLGQEVACSIRVAFLFGDLNSVSFSCSMYYTMKG